MNQDFQTEFDNYLEQSAQCESFWKSAGLIAAWPSMWPGLRKDYVELYKNTVTAYQSLIAQREADPNLADVKIPEPPEKTDPFDLSK